MLIVCPSCASEYTIDPATLGADGRTVRCAICRDTWLAAPDAAEPEDVAGVAGAVLLRAGGSGGTRAKPARRSIVVAGATLCVLALVWPPAEDWRQAEAFVSEALLGPSRPAFRDVISEVVGPQGGDLGG